MKTMQELRDMLRGIDRRGYPAYKDLRGSYQFTGYILSVDHVQADPFAPPSRLSLRIPGREAGFPPAWYDTGEKRVALQDHLLRLFCRQLGRQGQRGRGTGKSGLLSVSRCGQEVLERTACVLSPEDGGLLVRFSAGFPANGRTINARELSSMLFEVLPGCVAQSFFFRNLDKAQLQACIDLAEDQRALRDMLPGLGLCAFVANGAVLPRESGVSQRPMQGAVPFVSPPSMEVTVHLPHRGKLSGMGLRKGVTLVVGGGFHGKSTLLRALEAGVYDHIAGDGREYVVSDPTAVKIRAEDGRSIRKADISMFIRQLPGGRDTTSFSTEEASGSTSQAANLVEAWEAGSSLLLIDEDTCATNFMIRDELMQRVVHRDKEPIRPFIEQIRRLYEQEGISTILVAGSSGLFFHTADWVVQMDCYRPLEITARAKAEAAAFPLPPASGDTPNTPSFARQPRPDPEIKGNPRARIKALGTGGLQVERENIDLARVEQLVDAEQTAALGYLLRAAQDLFDGKRTLREVVDSLWEKVAARGLASLGEEGYLPTDLALPRRQEIFACLNRHRGLRL